MKSEIKTAHNKVISSLEMSAKDANNATKELIKDPRERAIKAFQKSCEVYNDGICDGCDDWGECTSDCAVVKQFLKYYDNE